MQIRIPVTVLILALLTLTPVQAMMIENLLPQSGAQYRDGIEALREERYPEAESLAKGYVSLSPASGRAHLILVLAWYGQNSHGAIDRHLRELDENVPEVAHSVRASLVPLYAGDGYVDRALTHYGKLPADVRTAKLHVIAGDLQHRSNRMDLAISEYEKALALDPGHEGARLGLARSYLVVRDFRGAASHAEQLLDRYPEHTGALTIASTAYLKLNQPGKALQMTRVLGEQSPGNPVAMASIALAEFANGHYGEARKAFSELDRYSSWADDAVVGLALSDIADERIEQARSVLDGADTRDAPLSTVLAAALITNEAGTGGVQHTIATGAPLWIDLQRPLLSLSGLVGTTPVGVEDYNHELVAVVLAQLYLNQGFPELAIDLSRLVGDLEASAFGRLVLSRAHWKAGRADEARQTLEALVRDFPKLVAPRLELADIRFHQGEKEEALAIYEHVVARHPELPELKVRLGDLYNELGNPNSALAQYQQYLELEPDSPHALNQAAATLALLLDRPEEALEMAERAYQLAPDNANIADTLVKVHRKLGNDEIAAEIRQSFSRTHGQDMPSS